MFEIYDTKSGEVIALAEEPRYVYRSPKNGVWIRCDEPDAECIAVNGARYSIRGRAEVDDAPDTVAVRKVDAAQRIAAIAKSSIANAQTLEEVKYRFEDLVDAVIDLIDWRYADDIAKLNAEQNSTAD